MTPATPWLSFSDFLRGRCGGKTLKVCVDAGFSCPNREGGRPGCAWCDNASFSPASRAAGEVTEQVRQGLARLRARHPGVKRFIAYFQAFTNTYAPPGRLRELYAEALAADPEIVGLAIGTRPDCVDAGKLAVLEDFARRAFVQVEYGLQSINDATLAAHGRGHTVADFSRAMALSRGRGLCLCAHVIVGLPGDTLGDAVRAAEFLAAERVDGIKIHNLHVVRGTPLAERYAAAPFPLPTAEEYAQTVARMLRRLPPTTAVQRLVAAPMARERLLAPLWCLDGQAVTERIKQLFVAGPDDGLGEGALGAAASIVD